MNEVTAKGQTVEEAVQIALKQLAVSREQVEIRVIAEGKKGFFGFLGAKPAIVEVVKKRQPEAVELEPIEEPITHEETIAKKDPIEETVQYVKAIIAEMKLQVQTEVTTKGRDVMITLSGDQVALLIGKRGNTLNALQSLAQLAANRHTKQYINIILDAENYREKRKETLESLAQRLARQAVSTRTKVVLEPMPSFERKIIHQTLSHHPHIETTSEGAEPHRHVVIFPK